MSSRGEPRPRLPRPGWMDAWPPGLRPRAIRAVRAGVELRYRTADARWIRVGVRLGPGGIVVRIDRRDAHQDRGALARLGRALGQRLNAEPEAPRWLAEAVVGWRALTRWRSWAGAGEVQDPRQEARDELLGLTWAVARRRSLTDAERERVERCLAALASEPLIVGLSLALWIAVGEIDRAVASAREVLGIAGTGDEPARLAAAALAAGFIGRPLEARAALERLVAGARDPEDLRAAAELFERLGLPGRALAPLQAAAEDADDRSSWRRLAAAAIAAGQREAALPAARRLLALARDDDERLAAAATLEDAGAFADAEAIFETLELDAAELALARLRLWRLDHREAARLAGALVAAGRGGAAARRILGAAAVLDGRRQRAIAELDRAIELDPRDDEALLWRARARIGLGEIGEARLDLGRTDMGDRPAWQLMFGLIEELLPPDSRTHARERYFVEHNLRSLRSLLGGPDDDRPILERIEDALARLGGNLGVRSTTTSPEAGLRWLDELESPRTAAERLQRRIIHDDPDEVLAAFAQRAAAAPDVPTFVTYAAEIHLWRGDYEAALALFEGIWMTTRTRWGYVGGGAAAMLLGRFDRALELWAEGAEHYRYMDTEATYAYRGELYLRRGQLELARRDLEQATATSPTRLGAWIALALVHARSGDEPAMRRCVAAAEALAPVLFALLRPQTTTAQELLELALERMRGNRSSVIHTFYDDGRLHVVPAGELEAWRKAAARLIEAFVDELQSSGVAASLGRRICSS